MRKVEEKISQHISVWQPWKNCWGNHVAADSYWRNECYRDEVRFPDGKENVWEYLYCGNPVAWGNVDTGMVWLDNCGWDSPTTVSRLNAFWQKYVPGIRLSKKMVHDTFVAEINIFRGTVTVRDKTFNITDTEEITLWLQHH